MIIDEKKRIKVDMEIQSLEIEIKTYKHSLDKLNDIIYNFEGDPDYVKSAVERAEKIHENICKLNDELKDLRAQARDLEDPLTAEANKDYYTGIGRD